MKQPHNVFETLLDWLLICAGVLAALLCLTTAFGFPMSSACWITVPTLSLFLCLLFRGKHGKYYALGLLALLALTGWLIRAELREAFRNLWGELCRRFVKGYDWFRDFLPREETSLDGATPAIVALSVLETCLCALSVGLWRRTLPGALGLLLCVVPCFILIDTPPALPALLAAVFCVLTLAFSQSVRRRATSEGVKAVALAAVVSAGLLGLLLLLFPQKTYSPPISWDDLTKQMEHWGQEQNNRGNVSAGLDGNPEQIDLTELGALPIRSSPVLYATTTREGKLYLRRSSYAEFTGDCWQRGETGRWDARMLFPDLRQDLGETLTVQTVRTEPLLYTTYQLSALPEGGEVVSDAYVQNTRNCLVYSMRWLPWTDPVSADPAYADWVQAHCLALPGQTRRGVLDWWNSRGGGSIRTESDVRQAASRVSQCASYSRNPLPMPAGADFCTWFLNDAEEGYCVHYATACTALLRALGVPARYVVGYVCTLPANRRTEVTNLNAHAWVEAWIGGRWIKVEPTPGDATEFTGDVAPNSEASVSETETADASHREPLTDTLPPWTGEAETRRRPSFDSSVPTDNGSSNQSKRSSPDLFMLWVFLSVVGVVAAILAQREVRLRIWEKRLARAENNERARLLYRRILRLRGLGGSEIPEEAVRLANRAIFSQHALSDEELQYLRQIYDQQVCRVAIDGFWKKLWCKYVLALF